MNLAATIQQKPLDEADEDEEADLAGDGWMKNSLKFESNDPVLAKDANKKGLSTIEKIILLKNGSKFNFDSVQCLKCNFFLNFIT